MTGRGQTSVRYGGRDWGHGAQPPNGQGGFMVFHREPKCGVHTRKAVAQRVVLIVFH